MASLQLTFPVFFHCAVKGVGPVTQRKAMDLLLSGHDDFNITDTLSSNYAKGRKPLPKATIYELLQLSDAELFDRLQKLNYSDVFSIAEAVVRLLDAVDINPNIKDQLLQAYTPEEPYNFLMEVFRAALKNSAFHTASLSKEDLDKIQTCRSGAQPQTAPLPKEESVPPQVEYSADELKCLQELSEMPVRNIVMNPPRIEHGKTTIPESYLKFMADLEDGETNPLEKLGDYEEHLLVRTLHPVYAVTTEDILETFYSLMDGDEPPFLPLDYDDLMMVAADAPPHKLCVLECMGWEDEVLHYLADQPYLGGCSVRGAAIIAVLSAEAPLELVANLTEAVRDSTGLDVVPFGVRMSTSTFLCTTCVRILLVRD